MKKDIYDIVTDRIIEALENNEVAWHKTWNTSSIMPANLISKKPYRGINTFLLSMMNFDSPYWLTYKQAKLLKGSVKKGAKGTPVIFWKWFEKRNKETGAVENIPFLKYYTVFNIDQTENINPDKIPVIDEGETIEFNPIELCEKVIREFKDIPEIEHKKSGAYYVPVSDIIGMPDRNKFNSVEEYYSTLYHEAVHSTGHKKRLDRKGITEPTSFASHLYSKEELVAEMGASFLCCITNISNVTFDNSVAYIQGWIKKLKNDNKLLVQAAGLAQKATDYILNTKFEES